LEEFWRANEQTEIQIYQEAYVKLGRNFAQVFVFNTEEERRTFEATYFQQYIPIITNNRWILKAELLQRIQQQLNTRSGETPLVDFSIANSNEYALFLGTIQSNQPKDTALLTANNTIISNARMIFDIAHAHSIMFEQSKQGHDLHIESSSSKSE